MITSGAVYDAIENLPQANWNETSQSSKAYIQNKPTNVSAFTNDAGYVTASQVPAAQVNSDWNAVSGVSQILNKPDLSLKEDKSNKVLVISSASTDTEYPSAKAVYHETNGLSLMLANHTADIYNLEVGKEDKSNKVTSMSASSTNTQYPSAKAVYDAIQAIPVSQQVQSDWNQTDNTAPDYIKNKPVIPTVPTNVSAFTNDADYTTVTDATDIAYGEVQILRGDLKNVAFSGSYTDLINKPTIPAPQVQADWQQNDTTAPDYIKHRPSLPSAQIQSDWTQTNSNEVDYIKHKPNLSAVATSGSYNDLSNKPTLSTVATTGSYSDLSGKPSFATVATSGSYTDLSDKPVIPAGQIQSDWSQTNTGSLDYIKNKPNMSLKEDVSNKVTTLSAQSTDTQYPSAKATYGILSSVESMLEDTEETVQTWLTYKEDLSNKSQQFRDNTANMVNYPSTIAVTDYVNDKMSGLDYTDNVSGDYVTSVSETDGVISLTKGSKGTITSGSTGLVDGDTVYTALQNIPVTTQVQSDWDESDNTDPSYIQNKPNLNLKEDVSNKIIRGSDSSDEVYESFRNSTDTQYASARAINYFAKYLMPDYHHFTSATVNLSSDYILNKLHIYDFDTTTNTLTIKYNTSLMTGKYMIWCISPYICTELDSTHTTATLSTYTAARKLVLVMRIE